MNRDVTAWTICRWEGLNPALYDGDGKPPYPLLSVMTPGQKEYAHQCLEYLLYGGWPRWDRETQRESPPEPATPKIVGEIIGYLKEFAEQQSRPPSEAFQLPG